MKKVGIIVGNGKLPLYFLEEAEKQNIDVFPLGLFDTIDDRIKLIKILCLLILERWEYCKVLPAKWY